MPDPLTRVRELRRPAGLRELVVAGCAVGVVVLLAAVALSTVQRARTFEALRAERLVPAAEREHVVVARVAEEPLASALRRAHALLGPGDRFALLVAPGVDRSTSGTMRLLSNQYLFPAVAVVDPAEAEVVIAVGDVPRDPELRLVLVRDGTWVGRRR